MHQEFELLINAINNLRQEPNFFKDYIFPIASAFFTSILGAAIAYFTLRYQEKLQIEKEKMDTTNKWTLLMDGARETLVAIKSKYYNLLSDNPIERVASIPTVLFHGTPVTEDFEKLSFIVPKADDKNKKNSKWSQISRIRSMVKNYNYLLQLWEQRNKKVDKQIKEAFTNQPYVNISGEEMTALIHLTEQVIKLTDDILIEIDDFLCNFPVYAKTRINYKRISRYGSILIYASNENEELQKILKKTLAPDFKTVETLFGKSTEEIQRRIETGYE